MCLGSVRDAYGRLKVIVFFIISKLNSIRKSPPLNITVRYRMVKIIVNLSAFGLKNYVTMYVTLLSIPGSVGRKYEA